MSTVFFLCVLSTELNGMGVGWQVESALVMALDLNFAVLQKKVIGFSPVMLTTILVGSFNRRIRRIACLSPLEIDSPIQFCCLSKFCGCDSIGSQLIFFVTKKVYSVIGPGFVI